jgi:hypothetical protein
MLFFGHQQKQYSGIPVTTANTRKRNVDVVLESTETTQIADRASHGSNRWRIHLLTLYQKVAIITSTFGFLIYRSLGTIV